MSSPRVLTAIALVLALGPAGRAAHAATGSGTIAFEFTSFSGPFASTDVAFVGDPAQWQLTGLVNGQTPAVNGVTSPAFPGFVYVGGTQALSGQSVSMVYGNVPGAIEGLVSFTPASGFSNVTTGQDFMLGTLSFTNGQWVGGAENPADNYPVTLNFRLSTSSATPEFNQVVTDALTVVTNHAGGSCDTASNQQDEADFLFLASAPQLGSMRVYDAQCSPPGVSNSGAVEVWGRFGSLDYVDFRNPAGGAFLSDSVDVGPIGGGGVPEPASWAMMIAGFGLAGATLRRRRRALA